MQNITFEKGLYIVDWLPIAIGASVGVMFHVTVYWYLLESKVYKLILPVHFSIGLN